MYVSKAQTFIFMGQFTRDYLKSKKQRDKSNQQQITEISLFLSMKRQDKIVPVFN